MKINKLFRNTEGVRGCADVEEWEMSVSRKSVLFSTDFEGSGGAVYEAQIKFKRTKEAYGKNCVDTKKGVRIDKSQFEVYCDCCDHKFTFAPFLQDNGLAYREHDYSDVDIKGSGTQRHVEYAGMCKHLRGLWREIKKDLKK
ncbi:hypothetical protein GR7B_00128 [Vibrio phage vB_VcorM_GR7B]|nr:hypothetical protein GR7B_00128 [Vibrio phage vB_VcorM_GR7B]